MSDPPTPAVPSVRPPSAGPATVPQYGVGRIVALWAAVTTPMGLLAFVAEPALAPRVVDLPRGLLHWMLMVVGMAWQFVLSVLMLRCEGPLDWASLRRRIRLNPPLDPRTGQVRPRLWWWVVAAVLANLALGAAAAPLVAAWSRVTGLVEPPWANIQSLGSPEFVGQWWIVALALISSAFNYVLGEELFFRGVLLPRMERACGRWDWVVNTVLFGLYHVHKIWFWPAMIVSSVGYAWVARRYRSLWMAIVVHGVEGVVLVFLVLAVVAGGWLP